jgi:uncharacterized protein
VLTALTIAFVTIPDKIVSAARAQLSWGTAYYSKYTSIKYPGGDLPKNRGVCTDVVIRSLRAVGYDLQKLIHEDMKKAWSAYPRYPGLKTTDRNIDHRRVPNQRVFFSRHGKSLTIDLNKKKEFKAGDFVTWKLPGNLDHIGVLTDKLNHKGLPYAVHNMSTTLEEDIIATYKITGHYRFPSR